MAEQRLNFFQVYYEEYQLCELYDFATPVFNTTLTPHFENAIICDVVPKSNAHYVGVCSWRLKQKRGTASEMILRRAGIFDLTEERIINTDFDIAILTPRRPNHGPLAAAVTWHGQAWIDSFAVLKRFLLSDLSIEVPDELIVTIYENHFIARGEIYSEYVDKCLRPVIGFMEENKDIFYAPSQYLKTKRAMGTPEKEIQETLEKIGMSDWPISVFLLERLFSIWIHGKNLSIINL